MSKRLSKSAPKPANRPAARRGSKAPRTLPAIPGLTEPPALPDLELIRDCVDYSRTVAGYLAGFDADPDGNNKFADDKAGQRLSSRAYKLLRKISRTPAKAAQGLQAKASIVPMILKNGGADSPDEREIDFLETFASEVRAWLALSIGGHTFGG
jgi:hypothetical protein